ncbi:hypothetical protein HDZ31DRAFT_36867 [Schizophyllum fasciatum]
MAGKRKHADEDASSGDVHEFSPPPEGEQMYTGSIIGERDDAFKVKWDPDPKTGKKYMPTWEPKKNCNEHMVKDWRRRVKRKQEKEALSRTSSAATASKRERSPSPSRPQKKRKVEASSKRSSREEVSAAPTDTQDTNRVGPPKGKRNAKDATKKVNESAGVSRRATAPDLLRQEQEASTSRRHSESSASKREPRANSASTASISRKTTAAQKSKSSNGIATTRSRTSSSIASGKLSTVANDVEPHVKARWDLYESKRNKLPTPRLPPPIPTKRKRRPDPTLHFPSASRPSSPAPRLPSPGPRSPSPFATSPNKPSPGGPTISKADQREESASPSRSPSIEVARKRKKRRAATSKPLKPIPRLSPSAFEDHLPGHASSSRAVHPPSGSNIESAGAPTQAETISEFSPEKRRSRVQDEADEDDPVEEGDSLPSVNGRALADTSVLSESQSQDTSARGRRRRPLESILGSMTQRQRDFSGSLPVGGAQDVNGSLDAQEPGEDPAVQEGRSADADEDMDDATREMEAYVDFEGAANEAARRDPIALREELEESTQDLRDEQHARVSDVDTTRASVVVHPGTQRAKPKPPPPRTPASQAQGDDGSFVPPTPEESQQAGDSQSSQDQQRIQELERDLSSSQAERGSFEARSQELEARDALARDLAASQGQSQSLAERVHDLDGLLLEARQKMGTIQQQLDGREGAWKEKEGAWKEKELEWKKERKAHEKERGAWAERELEWEARGAEWSEERLALEQECRDLRQQRDAREREWVAKEREWQEKEVQRAEKEEQQDQRMRDLSQKERQLQDTLREREAVHERTVRDLEVKLRKLQEEMAEKVRRVQEEVGEQTTSGWAQERDELEHRNTDLATANAEVTAAKAGLQSKIASLIPANTDLQRRNAELEEQIAALDGMVASLQEHAAELEDEVTEMRATIADKQSREAASARETADLAARCAAQELVLAEQAAESAEAHRLRGELEVAHDAALGEAQRAHSVKVEELVKAQQNLEDFEKQLEDAKQNLSRTAKQLEDSVKQLEDTNNTLATLRMHKEMDEREWADERASLEKNVENLIQQTAEEWQARVTAVQGELTAAKEGMRAAETRALEARKEVEALRDAKGAGDAAAAMAQAAEERVKAAEAVATAADDRVSQLEEQTSAVEKRLLEADIRVRDAEIQLQAAQKQLADAQGKVKHANARLQPLEDDRTALRKQIGDLESQITNALDLSLAKDAAVEDLEQARKACEEHEKQLASSATREAELRAEIASLQDRLAAPPLVATAVSSDESRAKLSVQLAEVEARLAAEVRARKAAEDDAEFMRKNYMEASSHVGDMRKEVVSLTARATIAEDQVTRGLVTIRETLLGRARALETERDRWRKQAEWVRDLDARTNGDVRRKAAERDDLAERVEALAIERRQLAILRDQLADERDAVIEERDQAVAARHKLASRREQLLAERDKLVSRLETSEAQTTRKLEEKDAEISALEKRLKSAEAQLDQIRRDMQPVYQCRWHADGTTCDASLESQQDLETHVQHHLMNE